MTEPTAAPLLTVEGLRVAAVTRGGAIELVAGIDLDLARGEVVGLVGESGCGKSVTARAVMRLLGEPVQVTGGRVLLDGRDLLTLDEPEMRRIRGNRIGMIFQEPMTSLNPAYTVGWQIGEAIRLHRRQSAAEIEARTLELLRKVGIGAPERRLRQYPHELSGGLRQRVMIAMALACNPALLIADEPTTALDVTVQAQILDVIGSLRRELGMAVLLITHDLGVVAEFCDRVLVMYAGRIVERAPVRELFAYPRHPYTAGLLAATPRLERQRGRLSTIAGTVPPPGLRPPGCAFADRCPSVLPHCREQQPPLPPEPMAVACWNPVP
ncbi:MAG: ABC transporter ATP-binding protein [Geminicoccaceae bacterium]